MIHHRDYVRLLLLLVMNSSCDTRWREHRVNLLRRRRDSNPSQRNPPAKRNNVITALLVSLIVTRLACSHVYHSVPNLIVEALPANEGWGKLIFSQVSVCPHCGGVMISLPVIDSNPPWQHHHPSGQHPFTSLESTTPPVNKRAVRILLGCFLAERRKFVQCNLVIM